MKNKKPKSKPATSANPKARAELSSSALLGGGLRIQIIGRDGPCGKTTLQVLLKELLEERGCKVSCTEMTPLRTLPPNEWERCVGHFHKGAAKRQLNPMRVVIDVIAT